MVEKSDQHQQFSTVRGPKLLYYNTFPQQKGKRASLLYCMLSAIIGPAIAILSFRQNVLQYFLFVCVFLTDTLKGIRELNEPHNLFWEA